MFDVVLSVGLTVALLGLAAWLWRASMPRLATMPAVLLGLAVLFSWGGIALAVYLRTHSRADDGSESVVDRVSEPTDRASFLAETDHRLRLFETEIDFFGDDRRRRIRLEGLHDRHVHYFVEQDGFGVGRVQLPNPYRHDVPVRLNPTEWPSSEQVAVVEQPPTKAMNYAHRIAVAEFLHVPGFGLVKDRQRVYGFEPHGFRERSESLPFGAMTVDRVELVSLLLHGEPAVYVSERLPTMAGVRDFPTRPLDDFETESLKLLRAGEDLTSATGHDVTLAFGSIRSAKQCVTCHGGQRGDLLGAFSYKLRSVVEQKTPK